MSNPIETIRFNAQVTVEQDIELLGELSREDLLAGLQSDRFTTVLVGGAGGEFTGEVVDTANEMSVIGNVLAQRTTDAVFTEFSFVDTVDIDEDQDETSDDEN